MVANYGVLRGVVKDFGREDDNNSPHYQIVLEANANRFRIPVNVKSTVRPASESKVLFAMADPLVDHRLLNELPSLADGFTPKGTGNFFLDYLREPMAELTSYRELSHNRPGADDDLQDQLELYASRAKRDGIPVYAFGAMFGGNDPRPADHQFNTNGGIHDIHMNQGNPANGGHSGDNGIHQDGGLIFQFANGFVGLFLAFQSQLIPTDDRGFPMPGAAKIPFIPEGVVNTVSTTVGELVIVGACVNPRGTDTGNETVVLLNPGADAIDLALFSVAGNNGNGEALSGTLAGGDAIRIKLSGNSAQLTNNGGSIKVLRAADGAVVHAVTYSKQLASQEGRTLVF